MESKITRNKQVLAEGPGVMMQDPGSETTSDGPANQNGGGPATEGGAREGPPKSATPTGEVSAADILHLQQHQALQVARQILMHQQHQQQHPQHHQQQQQQQQQHLHVQQQSNAGQKSPLANEKQPGLQVGTREPTAMTAHNDVIQSHVHTHTHTRELVLCSVRYVMCVLTTARCEHTNRKWRVTERQLHSICDLVRAEAQLVGAQTQTAGSEDVCLCVCTIQCANCA
ncbi:basic-leucine zipper transcription factor A-like isoform X2 [Gadus macrocephalus]|nr:basic-leucine zipper transcription factor A-like isoform X2 [Gadus macrocephalus]